MAKKRRKKHWSQVSEEAGIRYRIYERAGSSLLWFGVTLDGKERRQPLKTEDRELAKERAKEIAIEVATARLTGTDVRRGLTLAQLFQLYREHRLVTIEGARKRVAETLITLFTAAWGGAFPVTDLSQSHVDQYVTARRAGTLAPDRKGRALAGARDGTIDGDFRWLRSVFNFARAHRIDGRSALSENPLERVRGISWPKEKQPARPIASHDRYSRTQEHSDTVDPSGRLRCIVALARYTGRRESAICSLRASDVLRDRTAIAAALAKAGMDDRMADYMPNGAVRWPAETDKMGFLFVAPLSKAARDELDRYLRKNPRVGDVPLFPGTRTARGRAAKQPGARDPRDAPIRRDVAARWLLKAEELAGLHKLTRGAFHPYRRLWATERKGLPAKDVAHAGGWRDVATMELAYQGTDPATVLRVVEAGA